MMRNTEQEGVFAAKEAPEPGSLLGYPAGRRGSWGGVDDFELAFEDVDVPPSGVNRRLSGSAAFDVKFIQSTFLMLEDCSRDHPEIISWTKGGDAIEVKDIASLEGTILPSYFNSNKYASFVRQLNKYDFKRRKPEPCLRKTAGGAVVRDIFEHEYFRQGQKALLSNIKRKEAHAGNKRFASEEEVQYLKSRLRSLEEGQAEILKSIKSLQDALGETKPAAQATEPKEKDAIERLEYRLRSVEGCLFNLMNQRHPMHPRQQHHHSVSWPAGSSELPFMDRDTSFWESPLDLAAPQGFPSSAWPAMAERAQDSSPGHADLEMKELLAANSSGYGGINSVPLSRENTFDSKIRNLDLPVDMMQDEGDHEPGPA